MSRKRKKIFVETMNESYVMSVPADAKLTFGPPVPYEPRNPGARRDFYALRVYKGSKENLIAVIPDVKSFREEGAVRILDREADTLEQEVFGPIPEPRHVTETYTTGGLVLTPSGGTLEEAFATAGDILRTGDAGTTTIARRPTRWVSDSTVATTPEDSPFGHPGTQGR